MLDAIRRYRGGNQATPARFHDLTNYERTVMYAALIEYHALAGRRYSLAETNYHTTSGAEAARVHWNDRQNTADYLARLIVRDDGPLTNVRVSW